MYASGDDKHEYNADISAVSNDLKPSPISLIFVFQFENRYDIDRMLAQDK